MLLREGFSSGKTRDAYKGLNSVDRVLQSEADRSTLMRCKSRGETFDHLEEWHDPESEVATQKLYGRFHFFTITANSNPIEALHGLEDMHNQMTEKGIGIPDTFLHARFVRMLSDEYGHVKVTLRAMKSRDGAKIIRMVDTRYFILPQKKGSQRSSRPPKQAFFSSKICGRRGARRGRGRGGTQGRGRGGNSNKGQGK